MKRRRRDESLAPGATGKPNSGTLGGEFWGRKKEHSLVYLQKSARSIAKTISAHEKGISHRFPFCFL
jgi:hypothetical protein